MGERLPYHVLTYPRSPVTGRVATTIHPVPDGHMDTCATGRMLTCGKITIIFPDWHYQDGLLTVCDTVCHPVTPPKRPGGSNSGYPRSEKEGGEQIFFMRRGWAAILQFFGWKIHVQTNMASCVLGHPKLFPAPQNNLPLAWRLGKGSTPKSLRLKAEKQKQKNKNMPLLYTDRLSRNGHSWKREWTLFVFSIYRKPYFFILWHSVV